MTTSSPRRVAIFWHYSDLQPRIGENPNSSGSGSSTYDALDSIRQTVEKLGAIASFKAYLDIATTPAAMRWELQACGVSIVDCGAISSDIMITADMISFAMDSSAPAPTIVLISKSLGLAYPMSMLRMRRCHLVLLSPKDIVERHLKYQATEFIEWEAEPDRKVTSERENPSGSNWSSSGTTGKVSTADEPNCDKALSPTNSSTGEPLMTMSDPIRRDPLASQSRTLTGTCTPLVAPPQYVKVPMEGSAVEAVRPNPMANTPTPNPPIALKDPAQPPRRSDQPSWRSSAIPIKQQLTPEPSIITWSDSSASATPVTSIPPASSEPEATALLKKRESFHPIQLPRNGAQGRWESAPAILCNSTVTIRAPEPAAPKRNAAVQIRPPTSGANSIKITTPHVSSGAGTKGRPAYSPRQIQAVREMVQVLDDLRLKGQTASNPGQVAPLVVERNRRIYEIAEIPSKKFGKLVEMGREMGWVVIEGNMEWIQVSPGWIAERGTRAV